MHSAGDANEANRIITGLIRFLAAQVAISGADFAIAETATLAVAESEGNGRMCLTLPRTLISVMGVEKILPAWRDLEVFLQRLARSSTAERMNPYTSMWSGAVPGQDFHLVLLDNSRTATLADPRGRAALRCILAALRSAGGSLPGRRMPGGGAAGGGADGDGEARGQECPEGFKVHSVRAGARGCGSVRAGAGRCGRGRDLGRYRFAG